MRRMVIDMNTLREQLELVDLYADTAPEEEMKFLDGLGDFLSDILHGDIICFYKETNGTTE
jgi:hypothetical protein